MNRRYNIASLLGLDPGKFACRTFHIIFYYLPLIHHNPYTAGLPKETHAYCERGRDRTCNQYCRSLRCTMVKLLKVIGGLGMGVVSSLIGMK